MTYKNYRPQREKEIRDKIWDGMVDLLASITEESKENANQTAPEHPQVQTGTMRRAITLDLEKKGDSYEGKVGIMKGKEGGDEALEYADRIEFGFTGVDAAGRSYNQPPYPFLYPAVKSHEGKIKDFFK